MGGLTVGGVGWAPGIREEGWWRVRGVAGGGLGREARQRRHLRVAGPDGLADVRGAARRKEEGKGGLKNARSLFPTQWSFSFYACYF